MRRLIPACVVLLFVLVACQREASEPVEVGPTPLAAAAKDAGHTVAVAPTSTATSVFDCDGSSVGNFSFVIKQGPGEIAVWLPLQFGRPYLVLGQSPAESGERFDGDGVTVWVHGDESLLEVDGVQFTGCKVNRAKSIWEHAKLSGVDFRAVGNEPGWDLEIRNGDNLKFVYDYGQSELIVPAPVPQEDAEAQQAVYDVQNDAYALTVRILAGPCLDSMSGEQFESHVFVDLGGKTFQGCGRALH